MSTELSRAQNSLQSIQVLLAIFYMVAAAFWSLPKGFPGKNEMDGLVSSTFLRLGLWQGWDMFSPNPRTEDIYISAKAFFPDGSSQVYTLSRMTDYPFGKRYQRERWRKFFNDNLRLDAHKELWPDAADWVARRVAEKAGKSPATIELWRHWRACSPPGTKITKDFSAYRFFTHSVHEEEN